MQAALDRGCDNERRARDLAAQQAYLSLGTGFIVYGLTGQLSRLQSVLLVDYADALTLGVPVAFKSAMARAAARGVLLRGGAAIERLAALDTLVLDDSAGLTDSELREDAASALTRLHALGFRQLVRGNFAAAAAAAAAMDTGILGGAVLGWLSPVASAFLHNGTTIATLLHALKGVVVDGAAADRPGPAGAAGSTVPAPLAAAPRVSCVQGRSAAPGSTPGHRFGCDAHRRCG